MSRLLALLRSKRAWIPLLLLTAYGLFGFLIAPRILRDQILSGIRTNLHRDARLARVRVNPFFLSVALEGFELRDPDGTPFVGFDRLFVDFQVSSLVRWAFTFREFSITNPRVHVRLLPGGQLNFADLISKEQSKPPRLIIGRFAVVKGSLRFTNLMVPEPEEFPIEPIDLDLRDFTTIPDREGRYHIVAKGPGGGGWQWSGNLTTEPVHAAGTLEIAGSSLRELWQIARNRVGIEITDGQLGCRINYQVDVKGDSVVARLYDTSLGITGAGLRQKGTGPELLHLDTLAVTGIEVRYPQQTAAIGRVLVAGPKIGVWVNPDSTLNWKSVATEMAAAGAHPVKGDSTPAVASSVSARDSLARAASPPPSPPPWTVTLTEFAVRDLSLAFEDRTLKPPFALAVGPAHFTLRNVSSVPGSRFDLESNVTIADQAVLTCSGAVAATPASADIKLSLTDLPLAIFQPYLNPVTKLRLVGGTLSLSGDLAYRDHKPIPDVRFRGRVESDRLLTRDKIDNERFLAWRAFRVEGIRYGSDSLSVGSVRLVEPYAKLMIHRDRTTNLQDVLGLAPAPPDSAAADSTGGEVAASQAPTPSRPTRHNASANGKTASASKPPPAGPPALRVRIGRVEVERGSSDFADLSLLLPFAARIANLRGSVTGLSSDSASLAVVELDGSAWPSGSAQVRGVVNPLAREPHMDLTVVFRGFNMPALTPYTGQFLGREVDQGKMSLDLRYLLDNKHLKGENKILLDHFELGKKVESPEATKLPVGLAIAILKDDEGMINLDVPVEGDVGDPRFRIGRVILQFILSLLKKIATSPFKLLGALIGGGDSDQLSHVDFAAGTADLAPDQQESLAKLAEALGKRPALRLEVRGRSDADLDAVAIRKAKFATLASEKLASDPKRYGGLGYSTKLLEDMYVDRFDKDALRALEQRHRAAAGSLDPEHPQYKAGSKQVVVDERALSGAIQDTLTASLTVDEAELLSLANARGNAIRQSLLTKGVDEARVFILDPEPGKIDDGRIRIDLTLTH